MTAAEKFRRLLADDSRYSAETYNFVYEALDWTLKNVVSDDDRESQHVTGPELLEGIRQCAVAQFGCLARTVLESWGVSSTDDFGEVVFNLVEYDLMGAQETDRREDFHGLYDFEEAFDLVPQFSYSADTDEWDTDYVVRANEPLDA